MPNHQAARAFASEALHNRFWRTPYPGEIIHLAAIAWIETSYGAGWKGAGRDSYNMGAIQCGSSWTGDRFSYTDTRPNPDGTSTRYQTHFRKYPTPLAGWSDLVDVAYIHRGRKDVRLAAELQNTLAVSQALYDTHYYEGWGATPAIRVAHHYRSMCKAIAAATEIINQPPPITELPHTVRIGDRGPVVKQLQMELRLAADSIFGPITDDTLREYQSEHGLTVDGIAGPITWKTLFADDYHPELP
jgi:hypothetical protein